MSRRIRTTPRKLPQQERSQVTVDAILTATAHILLRDGYDTASTNRIAERAGVSIGSLYQYFPNKEALVAALIERRIQKTISVIELKLQALSDAPLEVALHELVKAVILAHAVEPELNKVFMEQIPRVGQLQRVTDVEKYITSLIRAYLEDKQEQIRPTNLDLAAFVVARTIEALIHAAVTESPSLLIDGQLEQEITDLLLRYLSTGSNLRANTSCQ